MSPDHFREVIWKTAIDKAGFTSHLPLQKPQRLPAKTPRAFIYLVAGKGFEPMTFGL